MMKSNLGAESSNNNDGEVVVAAAADAAAAASNESPPPPVKREFCCKYCDKKFTSYQALGGHHNAHKAERDAEKQKKIFGMASSYSKKSSVAGFVNSNHAYGFGGRTLGVSPLSMPCFKPLYNMGGVTHGYVALPWHQILDPPQPTMHQFMAEGSGFNQNDNKSYHQPLISSAGGPNSPLHLSLCDEGSFVHARNSSTAVPDQNAIIERPDENSDGDEKSSSSISMPLNGAVKKLDLTLRL